MTERDQHAAHIQGRIDGIKEAIGALECDELEHGPWWYLRDAIARGLHWLAIRIEPRGPDR